MGFDLNGCRLMVFSVPVASAIVFSEFFCVLRKKEKSSDHASNKLDMMFLQICRIEVLDIFRGFAHILM